MFLSSLLEPICCIEFFHLSMHGTCTHFEQPNKMFFFSCLSSLSSVLYTVSIHVYKYQCLSKLPWHNLFPKEIWSYEDLTNKIMLCICKLLQSLFNGNCTRLWWLLDKVVVKAFWIPVRCQEFYQFSNKSWNISFSVWSVFLLHGCLPYTLILVIARTSIPTNPRLLCCWAVE